MMFSKALPSLLAILQVAVGAPAAGSQITKSRHGTITFNTTGDIVRASIYNPPINLVDSRVSSDLHDFITSLSPANRSTPAPKAVIFSSGHPDIFLDHLDANQLLNPPTAAKQAYGQQWVETNRLVQALGSTVFVAEVDGVGLGAGLEFAVQLDLRYAGPKARLASIENALGADAGTGGQLFLARLVGKSAALEHDLAVAQFDGPAGARAGLFNAYYDTSDGLRRAVDDVAARIALRTPESINATKATLNDFLNPTVAQLDNDAAAFNKIVGTPNVQQLIQKYLAASKNQTSVEFELGGPDTYLALSRP